MAEKQTIGNRNWLWEIAKEFGISAFMDAIFAIGRKKSARTYAKHVLTDRKRGRLQRVLRKMPIEEKNNLQRWNLQAIREGSENDFIMGILTMFPDSMSDEDWHKELKGINAMSDDDFMLMIVGLKHDPVVEKIRFFSDQIKSAGISDVIGDRIKEAARKAAPKLHRLADLIGGRKE